MESLLPTIHKFGNKFECVVPVDGIISLRMTHPDCPEMYAEIDSYHETADGERIHTVIIMPLAQLEIMKLLSELSIGRIPGEFVYTAELPHG